MRLATRKTRTAQAIEMRAAAAAKNGEVHGVYQWPTDETSEGMGHGCSGSTFIQLQRMLDLCLAAGSAIPESWVLGIYVELLRQHLSRWPPRSSVDGPNGVR